MGPEWLVITPSGKMLQRRGKRLEGEGREEERKEEEGRK